MARTYGRVTNPDGSKTWVIVQTDAAGYSENVWLTTLCQCLKLNLGESPFFGNLGIPAQQSVIQQIYPDWYVGIIQSWFAPYFASLVIQRLIGSFQPVYNVSAVCFSGAILTTQVAV